MVDDRTDRMMRYDAAKRSVLVAYLLWAFLGWLGAHRLYAGRYLSGLLMFVLWGVGTLLTFVFVGYIVLVLPVLIWLIDLFLIPGMIQRYNEALIGRLGY